MSCAIAPPGLSTARRPGPGQEPVPGRCQQSHFGYWGYNGNGLGWGDSYDKTQSDWANFGRLWKIKTEVGATVRQDLEYGYDAVGNVRSVDDQTDGHPGGLMNFDYDHLDRLVSAYPDGGQGYIESFAYNPIGNITSTVRGGVTKTYSYGDSAHKHAVTGISIQGGGSQTYTYDANGNMLTGGGRTITWDIENRPTQVVSGTTTVNFTYDGDGKLVKRTIGGVSTVYVGNHHEKNLSTGEVTKYYYAGGKRIAMREAGVVYYILADHLGGTSTVLDSGGANPLASLYYSYGESRGSVSGLPTDRLFTGQQLHASIGLYFYGARFYDPAIGRFVVPDTIVPEAGNPQALNRYSYVYNNPMKFIDPSGHDGSDVASLVPNWFGDEWVNAFRAAHGGADPQAGDYLYRFVTMAAVHGMAVLTGVRVNSGGPTLQQAPDSGGAIAGAIGDFFGAVGQAMDSLCAAIEAFLYGEKAKRSKLGTVRVYENVEGIMGSIMGLLKADAMALDSHTILVKGRSLNMQAREDQWILRHELEHTSQARALGPLYLPAYAVLCVPGPVAGVLFGAPVDPNVTVGELIHKANLMEIQANWVANQVVPGINRWD